MEYFYSSIAFVFYIGFYPVLSFSFRGKEKITVIKARDYWNVDRGWLSLSSVIKLMMRICHISG